MGIAIFNRKAGEGMKLEIAAQGTVTADGTEQDVVVDTVLSNLSGFVDLGEMQAGDSIDVRQYIDINGGYVLYAGETYSNVQPQPVLHFTPKGSNSRVKVTLQQTAGAYRHFGYEFVREV